MHTHQMDESPFLTTREAAGYLRVSERTVQNWRYAGTGPAYRKHVGVVVYHIDDLNAFSRLWKWSGGERDAT